MEPCAQLDAAQNRTGSAAQTTCTVLLQLLTVSLFSSSIIFNLMLSFSCMISVGDAAPFKTNLHCWSLFWSFSRSISRCNSFRVALC